MVMGPEVGTVFDDRFGAVWDSSAPPLFILRIFCERLALGIFAEGLVARALAERFLLRILAKGFPFGRAAVRRFVLRVLRTLAESFVFGAAAEGNARN